MSLQAKLEAIRKAVEAKTIACPCVEGPACSPTCSCHKSHMSGGCKVCGPINYSEGQLKSGHTAHRLPDQAYAALLRVVRERAFYEDDKDPRYVHSGWATRNWEGLPPGALEGALAYGIERIWERDMEAGWLKAAGKLQNLIRVSNCIQEAACDAVLLALGVEEPDAR